MTWSAMDEAAFQDRAERLRRPPPHPLEIRAKTYRVSRAFLEALFEAQGGGCAICGEMFRNPTDFAVDHDHATGKVRGLLCARCNTGLGCFRDSTRRLLNAIRYLAPSDFAEWQLTERSIGAEQVYASFERYPDDPSDSWR